MTPEPHVLAIDLGTSNLKVALVGLGGRIAAATAHSRLCHPPLEPVILPPARRRLGAWQQTGIQQKTTG